MESTTNPKRASSNGRDRPSRHLRLLSLMLAALTAVGTVAVCTGTAAALPPGYRPNGCTLSPDRGVIPVYYDFKGACDRHDYCYDEMWFGGGEVGRSGCDSLFLTEMRAWCHSRYGAWWLSIQRAKCDGVAWTYYGAVRNFGRSYFNNPYKN